MPATMTRPDEPSDDQDGPSDDQDGPSDDQDGPSDDQDGPSDDIWFLIIDDIREQASILREQGVSESEIHKKMASAFSCSVFDIVALNILPGNAID